MIRSEGIDTSGSVPGQTLAEFWAELREVVDEIRPERVVVLQVDAALQDAAKYTADDLPDEVALKSRGDTDFWGARPSDRNREPWGERIDIAA